MCAPASAGFPCRAPWDGALIHWSGAVYPCGLVCHRACGGSLRLGHLDEQPLAARADAPIGNFAQILLGTF